VGMRIERTGEGFGDEGDDLRREGRDLAGR
jgi:hypothetical protein